MPPDEKKGDRRSSETARWMHLLHLETEIDLRLQEGSFSTAALLSYLDSVNEAFSEYGDPIKNFPSYALLRFSRKLRQALVEQGGKERAVEPGGEPRV